MIKRKQAAGGGHSGSWVISFADLMSLLMAFFVMLLSFSVQDQEKLAQASGSVKDAFGITIVDDKAGMIERSGNPLRPYPKHLAEQSTEAESEFATKDREDRQAQGQEAETYTNERTDAERAAMYSLAAASLRQAWQDQPDITAVSENLVVQETEEGINIVIADQQGRAMFPDGSKYPYEVTRKAIAAMAPLLNRMPNQIRITGHTMSGALYPNPRYGKWDLSFDRANVARQILEEFGLSDDHINSVVGRGDSEPFFPNDPYLSSNQRIEILVMYEEPPVPVGLTP